MTPVEIIIYVAAGICLVVAIMLLIRNKEIKHTTNHYVAIVVFLSLGVGIALSGAQIDQTERLSKDNINLENEIKNKKEKDEKLSTEIKKFTAQLANLETLNKQLELIQVKAVGSATSAFYSLPDNPKIAKDHLIELFSILGGKTEEPTQSLQDP